ncbi:MAG: hypothetical protein KF747_01555 [Nitrospira sp.]|nr:hypothetical protein [Nitrospira sp.]
MLKIKRAKEHDAELQQQLHSFLECKPYKVGFKHDQATRKLIYYVTAVDSTPDCLPLIAGDVIQNLMSALDHLAYQIVCRDTGDIPPNPNWIYFPIADDLEKYEAKKVGKMQGASAATVAAVDAIKPYKGGNDSLWMLYRLNNIEKHRLLLTVGSQAAGINLGQLMTGYLRNTFPEGAVKAFESMDIYLNPADKGFPLQPGFELYIGAPDEQPNPKQQFRFDVVVNEPGICEGKPLRVLTNELIVLVDEIVTTLTPRLR